MRSHLQVAAKKKKKNVARWLWWFPKVGDTLDKRHAKIYKKRCVTVRVCELLGTMQGKQGIEIKGINEGSKRKRVSGNTHLESVADYPIDMKCNGVTGSSKQKQQHA